MNEKTQSANTSTELARERSREAADRTLMAWVRTSLSLIGFGFGIGKAHDYLRTVGHTTRLDPIDSMLVFGGAFILLGTLSMLAAVIQHWRILKRVKQRDFSYLAPLPLTEILAGLLLLVGLFAFVAIFL